MDFADIVIICGHYGCGKTNLALNLARDYRAAGEKVTIYDLDIVNPYFRSSDYLPEIEAMGAELIAPVYAHTNLDLPSLPAEMYSIFSRDGRIIIDVGGDDVGATALGRFAPQLLQRSYTMLYVVNKYRIMSTTAQETAQLLTEIETSSRLKADAIVNNSHVMQYTTPEHIIQGAQYARETARLTGLPMLFTAVERELTEPVKELAAQNGTSLGELYPVDIIVKKPWE